MSLETDSPKKEALSNLRAATEHGITLAGLSLLAESVVTPTHVLKPLMVLGAFASLGFAELMRLYGSGELLELTDRYKEGDPEEPLVSYFDKRQGSIRFWSNLIIDTAISAAAISGLTDSISSLQEAAGTLSLAFPLGYISLRSTYHTFATIGHTAISVLLATGIAKPEVQPTCDPI